MITRILMTLAALGAASSLQAIEPPDRVERLSRTLTLYQQNLALFDERYQLPQVEGPLNLRVDGISPQLQLDSLIARGAGIPTRLQLIREERNFQTRLQERLGSTLLLLSADQPPEEVRLLGVEGNGVLVSNGEYTELVPWMGERRVALPGVQPANQPPWLHLQTRGEAGAQLSLSYLSSGLGWQADYQLMLQPALGHLRLEGRATLSNNSGIDLDQVQVRLLAGSLNLPRAKAGPYLMEAMALRADSAEPAREAVQDYHLYSLAEPISLANGQQLALPLQPPAELPFSTRYHYTQHQGGLQQHRMRAHPRREISFRLPADPVHKTPLPAGSARVFVQQEQGLVFLGGQDLPATAAGEEVTLNLGEAFDLTLEQEQTRYERQGKNLLLGYRIRVSNSGDEARQVEINALFNQPHQLLESSHPSQARGAGQVWTLQLPANDEQVLEYSVRLQP